MVAAMDMHHVTLSDGSVVALDHTGEYYRLVHYRRRRPGDGFAHITASRFDDLVRREVLPRGYHTAWYRVSTKDTELKRGLQEVLKASKSSYDPLEVYAFIKTTAWGRELP